MRQGIPALIADNQMRQRDERFIDQGKYKAKDDVLYDKRPTVQAGQAGPMTLFKPTDFEFNDDDTMTCPAGKTLLSTGAIYTVGKGLRREDFKAQPSDCANCGLRKQCLRRADRTLRRKVVRYHLRQIDLNDPSQRMRRAIDSASARLLYSQRFGAVEPVFANVRYNKRLSRFNSGWMSGCMK